MIFAAMELPNAQGWAFGNANGSEAGTRAILRCLENEGITETEVLVLEEPLRLLTTSGVAQKLRFKDQVPGARFQGTLTIKFLEDVLANWYGETRGSEDDLFDAVA